MTAKTNWGILFQLEKVPENGANRADIAVRDKVSKTWILIERTVCSVGSIEEQTRHKYKNYREQRAGMKRI